MASEDIIDISHVKGNAPDEIKRAVGIPAAFYRSVQADCFNSQLFGDDIQNRLKCTEVSLYKKPEEPEKWEAKVVLELTVKEDMLNGGGNVHGGCSSFLIDICSTLAITALSIHTTGENMYNVSQALNIIFHSPARLGDELRIVNTTLTLGARAQSVRSEIWNVTHHRLVASGTHVKLQPSPAPKPLL